jgi:4a-hydroxytetrahydrobiopterin dehydratase
MTTRRRTRGEDYLIDAFALLDGWHNNGAEIYRTLPIDDAQHAALTERIKIYSDALQLRPRIRRRDGETLIGLASGGELSASEVTLAARIEDAYRTIVGRSLATDS